MRADVLVKDIDPRCDDAAGEDPFRDIQWNGWVEARELAQGEQIVGCESIDAVDSYGNE